jgi:3'(2'), 5'-bisphosphate nucleotidase
MDRESGVTMNDGELSEQVARTAGQLLLNLREKFGPPQSKEHANELRDLADRSAHECIVALIGEHRPGDAILSEEGKDNDHRLSADRVWIVDPLDGTWEYGQGRPDFAVHIALWIPQAQELQACTVDLPAQGVCRTMAGAASVPNPLPTDRPLRLVASRSRPPATLQRTVDVLSEMVRAEGVNAHGVEIVDVGSVGAKVNEIISGRAEAYVHDTGFYEWDVAAPVGVAQHLGFDAAHLTSLPVTFNHMPPYVTDLVVSHPQLTVALYRALAEAART